MKRWLFVLSLLVSQCVSADVYKCLKNNKIVFQDFACYGNEVGIIRTGKDKINTLPQVSQNITNESLGVLPRNAKIYLCYLGSNDLYFSEVPCMGTQKSADVKVTKLDGWGKAIPKLPRHNVDVSIMGHGAQEIDSLADGDKKIQMPEYIINKVKNFKKLTGKYKITQISSYDGMFYTHTAEMCLKDFYFNHEDMIKYGEYIDPSQCSFSDFKIVGDMVSYKKQCIEQGKKASNIVTISRNGLNGKIEQRVQDVAPSSEIGDDYYLEVIYSGACAN